MDNGKKARTFLFLSALAACGAASAKTEARMDGVGGAEVYVVQDVAGYNSWPMIQAVGGNIVCAYSRGSAHTIDEGNRGVFARVSSDGGKTWGPEVRVANDPSVGEVTIGKGVDSNGAMLLWVRCWGKARHHDLYRTTDGSAFKRIAAPALDPMPMQITDVFPVPGVGLMSLWFAGDYQNGPHSSWGILTSKDDGRTWTQRTVEKDLEKTDWPTEQAGVWLGDGRILVVARSEGAGCQFQITSADGGITWKRTKTNITDVNSSTPSLILDAKTGQLANYYYHRGARKMKRRTVDAAYIFDHPMDWPAPEILAEGHEERAWDAGNVNATIMGGRHFLATYTGSARDTSVVVVAPPPSDARVPLADPFILCEKGTYYAYGTYSQVGITVATSTDLVRWKMDQGRSPGGLALHRDDSFGTRRFWAPEVYHVGGRYVMFYSAEEHVCAAVADSPLGPFRQAEKTPILERKGIDNSLFIDDDGRAWMVYVHFDRGNVVWLAEMEKDCLHAKPGTARMILRAENGWEKMNPRCSVTEGPFIVKVGGTYVLTYSANDFRDPDYAVGVATAKNIEGPWTRHAGNPILRRQFGLKGTGHHSFFKDAEGKWRIVFHAHNDRQSNAISPRRMYIAGIDFKDAGGVPIPAVDDNLIRCVVAP